MSHFKNLTVRWSKRQKDFIIYHPRRCDGHLANNHFFDKRMTFEAGSLRPVFEKSFKDELESRGYDTTTLVFSVKRRQAINSCGDDMTNPQDSSSKAVLDDSKEKINE